MPTPIVIDLESLWILRSIAYSGASLRVSDIARQPSMPLRLSRRTIRRKCAALCRLGLLTQSTFDGRSVFTETDKGLAHVRERVATESSTEAHGSTSSANRGNVPPE